MTVTREMAVRDWLAGEAPEALRRLEAVALDRPRYAAALERLEQRWLSWGSRQLATWSADRQAAFWARLDDAIGEGLGAEEAQRLVLHQFTARRPPADPVLQRQVVDLVKGRPDLTRDQLLDRFPWTDRDRVAVVLDQVLEEHHEALAAVEAAA